jgi:hypothetical protein
LILGVLAASLVGQFRSAPNPAAPSPRSIALTRTVRIPVNLLTSTDGVTAPNPDPATLTIAPGAADERPEGPDSFDVLEDGSVVVTDPIRNRIAVFDAQGKYRQSWKIGFAADSVTAVANGLTLVREARTGQLHAFGKDGRVSSAEHVALPEAGVARLLSGNSGVVTPHSAKNSQAGSFAIRIDRPGSALISLEVLATDAEANSYVALESTAGTAEADEINVDKYVRKYAGDGRLVSETSDLPLDYYVTPVDELRVHRGIVYQLLTTNKEVRINVWDMN